ncbi:hypothetical protein FM107_11175 [Sphingobacterium sp. JB170]|nr:hypothetical protein FM107_11175 [Sphingobacterium sp. JB170]
MSFEDAPTFSLGMDIDAATSGTPRISEIFPNILPVWAYVIKPVSIITAVNSVLNFAILFYL